MQNATTLVAGSELEKKLAEATSNEPWGASGVKSPLCERGALESRADPPTDCTAGTLSAEIARFTYGYDDFKAVRAPWASSPLAHHPDRADSAELLVDRALSPLQLVHRPLLPHPGDDPHLEEPRAHWLALVRLVPCLRP